MTGVLMHKNTAVLRVEFSPATGRFTKCTEVLAAEHLPVGVRLKGGHADRAALNQWWEDRALPADRAGVRASLGALGAAHIGQLLPESKGLCAADCYWLRTDSGDSWETVNFYDNPFTEEVGDLLLGYREDCHDKHSPDLATDGYLRKKWTIQNGRRCLMKAGSMPYYQQPFNEQAAAAVMQALGVAHVPYQVQWVQKEPFSVCETMCGSSCEFVPAYRIFWHYPKPNNLSYYQHYLRSCQAIGAGDMTRALDDMITADFLTANEDRHFGNFGLLRNPDTLEWLGAAPLFDNGSSFGYQLPAAMLRGGTAVDCKPFKARHTHQLKLVTDFSRISFERLYAAEKSLAKIFADSRGLIDDARLDALTEAYRQRVQYLSAFASSHRSAEDNREEDAGNLRAARY